MNVLTNLLGNLMLFFKKCSFKSLFCRTNSVANSITRSYCRLSFVFVKALVLFPGVSLFLFQETIMIPFKLSSGIRAT